MKAKNSEMNSYEITDFRCHKRMNRARETLISSESKSFILRLHNRRNYLDESLHHSYENDDAGKRKGARQEQIEEGRAGDGRSKDSICWIDRCQEAARHLRDEVAPEERRVDGTLRRDTPLKLYLRST